MHEFNIALLAIAGSALLLGLFSKSLKRLGLSDSVALLVLGVLLGPACFGLLEPESWGNHMAILEQVARLALAVGLMGVALRLPRNFIVEHWRSLGLVLVLGMPFMWLCSSAIVGASLGLSAAAALLIGAAVTPTDPVIASTIVTGPVANEKLPAYLRQIISAESGANDGLAYLFVMAGIFLLSSPPGGSLTQSLAVVLFGQILGALVFGVLIGWAAGRALRSAEEKELIEHPSMLMFTTALALATLAGAKLIGSDGILAVFAAGVAFDLQINARERQQEERVVEGVDRFFISPIILLVALMIPWQAWWDLGWSGWAVVAGILTLRRLPVFLLLSGRTRDIRQLSDGALAGWFGPIGVAAVYYAAMAHHQVHLPELWPVVSLLAVASIIGHGLTAVPFSHWYARVQ